MHEKFGENKLESPDLYISKHVSCVPCFSSAAELYSVGTVVVLVPVRCMLCAGVLSAEGCRAPQPADPPSGIIQQYPNGFTHWDQPRDQPRSSKTLPSKISNSHNLKSYISSFISRNAQF